MEALVLLLIILVFGFFSFPLFSYFTLIGVYSFVFLDVGIIFWAVFAALGFVFLISKNRINLITKKLVNFINKKGLLPKYQTQKKLLYKLEQTGLKLIFSKQKLTLKK